MIQEGRLEEGDMLYMNTGQSFVVERVDEYPWIRARSESTGRSCLFHAARLHAFESGEIDVDRLLASCKRLTEIRSGK